MTPSNQRKSIRPLPHATGSATTPCPPQKNPPRPCIRHWF